MSSRGTKLIQRLQRLDALAEGGGTESEREAAKVARARLQTRLESLVNVRHDGSVPPPPSEGPQQGRSSAAGPPADAAAPGPGAGPAASGPTAPGPAADPSATAGSAASGSATPTAGSGYPSAADHPLYVREVPSALDAAPPEFGPVIDPIPVTEPISMAEPVGPPLAHGAPPGAPVGTSPPGVSPTPTISVEVRGPPAPSGWKPLGERSLLELLGLNPTKALLVVLVLALAGGAGLALLKFLEGLARPDIYETSRGACLPGDPSCAEDPAQDSWSRRRR